MTVRRAAGRAGDDALADRGPRLSAGLVVLRPGDSGEWRCLVLRAYRNWDFPKGLVEAGESPLKAAVRETEEETGLHDLAFPWGDAFYDTEPYAGGKVARFFLAAWQRGEATLPINPHLGRPEHHEFRWVPLESAALLLPPRLQHVIAWARERLASSATFDPNPVEHPDNALVARVLHETARVLDAQGANPYRAAAFRRAAATIRDLDGSVRAVFDESGVPGLDALPNVGAGIAAVVAEVLITGRSAQLDRLLGEADASHEPTEPPPRAHPRPPPAHVPPVSLLLELDAQYRAKAAAETLPKISPRQRNPEGIAWLPILHAKRDGWSFTLLYSNTARAHELGRMRDWVVTYYYDDAHVEGQATIVTETHGPLEGLRVVRGREGECGEHYRSHPRP